MKKNILTLGAALMIIGSHAQTFNFTGATQTYTVPALVTSITIDARGAQGGGSFNGAGGLGAQMTGTYAVTPGQVLTIIVGEQGHLQVGGNAQNSSGGGGGTFVYDASGPTLLVAAGGGGGKCNYTSSGPLHADAAGQIGTSGGASSDGAAAGGVGGNGGAAGLWSSVPCAGGGAGWLSVGGGPYGGFNAPTWAGGTGYCGGGGGGCGGIGGYGGGGGGGNHYGGGGGGGGYSGGGGGTDPTHGGGGGSYSIGTAQANTAGFQTGNGQVIIANANPCVGDVTPPTFTNCPPTSSVSNNAGICGAVVNFTAPTATDNCPGATGTQTFNFTGTPQTFTVPAGVTSITIDALGAQGGGSFNGAGGLGARMNATYAVTPGQVLTIIVGEQGHLQVGGNAQNSSGGGGGTFVYDASGPTLLVAAGGGGGKCNYTSSAPLHADAAGQIGTSGGASSDGAAAGGVGGNGGAAGLWSSVPCAGGGTGWLTAGGGPYGGFNAPTWAGGTGYCGGGGGGCGGIGGYGGGGGGGNHYGGGGGGGGYSGGGGGTDPTHGGGGGSYSIGTSQANTAGYQTGNGQVIIGYNVVSPTVAQTSGLPSGSTFPVGSTVNTFTATDPSGNVATCTFTVTVTDNENPVPSVGVLPTMTDECSVTLTAPTATDNCGTPTVSTLDPTSYSAEGTYTVNWVYTDAAGNTAAQTQTVIIDDVTAPLIAGCPSNITLTANNAGCTGITSWTSPTATDNCAGSPTVTASHTQAFAFPVGTTTVTYTFDDGNGNTSACTFDVTVTNDAAATLTIANDTVCIADGAFTITGESPAGGTFSGPGVSAGTFDPATAGVGTHAITYMYTDANGCSASAVTDSIYVDICTGSQNMTAASQFAINPNPNNGTFTLQLNSASDAVVVIYDAQGKLVSTQKVNNNNSQITIADSGMYLITVITADGQSTSQRVIVQE